MFYLAVKPKTKFVFLQVMNLLRYLLLPFSLLYGLVIFVRNKLYDWDVFSTHRFKLPVIAVGNLTVGGTGKTPHVEYLLRLFSTRYRVATLSRGYGRKTTGFLLASDALTAFDIGDEPQQYYKKFKTVTVAVDENRVHGINQLLQLNTVPELIVLDDAYQHRALTPGFSILLSDYAHLYCDDVLLPYGRLREGKAGAKRADCIVVTKTPAVLSPTEKQTIVNKLKPLPHQRIYFTYLRYAKLVPLFAAVPVPSELKRYSAIVLTGIAKPQPLLQQLATEFNSLTHINYSDHHVYTAAELEGLKQQFNALANPNKLIITTEKDAMRLLVPELSELLKQLPVYYLPIEVAFHGDAVDFDQQLLLFAEKSTTDR